MEKAVLMKAKMSLNSLPSHSVRHNPMKLSSRELFFGASTSKLSRADKLP